MTDFVNEVECAECKGEGHRPVVWTFQNRAHVTDDDCPECNGTGWRAMTEDEENDAAEAAYEAMCTSEPPITMQERHEAAWKLKQESRS